MTNTMMNLNNKEEALQYLKLRKAPLFGWESGIKSNNPDVLNFVNNNKEFFAAKINNKIHFFGTDGTFGLITSDIESITKINKYRRVETQNTVYHLIIIGDGFSKDEEVKPEAPILESKKEGKFSDITDIRKLTNLLFDEYPYSSYGSRCSVYGDAFMDKLITEEQYNEARKFYGNLWTYVGD